MKTWTFIDKTKWPERGPWDSEPDKAQWVDPTTGLDCLMVRAHSHWCGYVGVPEGHKWHGIGYSRCTQNCGEETWCSHSPNSLLDVHGGITFAGFCQEGDHEPRICHVPEGGRPDKVFWFGFDCAHSGDKRPAENDTIFVINQRYPHAEGYEHYRDFDYVKSQVTYLAQQLAVIQ